MVASAEQGYAKEWQEAVLADAAEHAAAHGLDTPFRPPKSWRVDRQSVPRRFREMTSDRTWQRLDTVAKAAAIVELPGKASEPIEALDVKKYVELLHLKDTKHALLGPGGYTSKKGATLRRTYLQPAVACLFADHAGLLQQALKDVIVSRGACWASSSAATARSSASSRRPTRTSAGRAGGCFDKLLAVVVFRVALNLGLAGGTRVL
jgi:hypothetical protein